MVTATEHGQDFAMLVFLAVAIYATAAFAITAQGKYAAKTGSLGRLCHEAAVVQFPHEHPIAWPSSPRLCDPNGINREPTQRLVSSPARQ